MKTRLSHTYDSDRQQMFSAQSSYKKSNMFFYYFSKPTRVKISYKNVKFKTPLTDLCGYERFLTGLNTCCRLTSQSCYVQVLQVSLD